MEGIASQAATAVDNARLFQKNLEAVALRDEFLSIASHELKTPLTSLKLQLQITQRSIDISEGWTPPPEQLLSILGSATSQVDRLTALVEDLLDVSRIQSGRLSYHFERTDIAELVRDMVERFSGQFEAAKCDVSLSTDEDVYALCDRFRFEQVIVNLLSNAIKYGAGNPVEIHVRRLEDLASVVIKDQGIGIPKNKQEGIFDRFVRAVSASQISGLGLGLYISREIVKAHNGSISVESEENRGSTFTVTLPFNPS